MKPVFSATISYVSKSSPCYCVRVVQEVLGGISEKLEDATVEENEPFTLKFATTGNKYPDFTVTMPNGTVKKLVASGQVTAEANKSDCKFDVIRLTNGFNVTMSCPSAQRRHAGTYSGTDNDDAANAQKTSARVVITPGMLVIQVGYTVRWLCGTVLERRALTGELSLSCARPTADR